MSSTVRVYYDAVIAVALMVAVAIVFGFLAGVIADTSAVSVPIAGIAFLLTGAVLFFRFWRISRRSSLPQANPGT